MCIVRIYTCISCALNYTLHSKQHSINACVQVVNISKYEPKKTKALYCLCM